MTAIKTALDVYIDANVMLAIALAFWLGAKFVLSRPCFRVSFASQLRVLQAAVICLMLSPILALGLSSTIAQLWPNTPIRLSDMVVASYLRGEIKMEAIAFEELLATRGRWTDALVAQSTFAAQALAAAFALGAGFFLLRFGWSALKLRRVIRASFVWRHARHVDVRLSDEIAVPFAARGLWRYHVLLPSDILARPVDLKIALAHEFQHIRQGDALIALLLEVMRPLFFWNPAFARWKREFEGLQELACDQHVVQQTGVSPRVYADCLLRFCEGRTIGQAPRLFRVALVRRPAGVASRSAKAILTRRCLSLRRAEVELRPCRVFVGLLVLVMAASTATVSASLQRPHDWSQDRLMLSTVVNLERLELINRRYP